MEIRSFTFSIVYTQQTVLSIDVELKHLFCCLYRITFFVCKLGCDMQNILSICCDTFVCQPLAISNVLCLSPYSCSGIT